MPTEKIVYKLMQENLVIVESPAKAKKIEEFLLKGGETGHVNFTFEVSDKYTVMACRMVADGDTFSADKTSYANESCNVYGMLHLSINFTSFRYNTNLK